MSYSLLELDAASGAPLRSWHAHEGEINSLAFSRDGKLIASASDDGTARIWDVASGREVGPPLRHERALLGVAFRPEGNPLAVGDRQGLVHIWDWSVPEELVALSGHRADVDALRWSADGESLASSSGDGTVRVWTTQPVRARNAARRARAAALPDLQRTADALWAETPDLDAACRAAAAQERSPEEHVWLRELLIARAWKASRWGVR